MPARSRRTVRSDLRESVSEVPDLLHQLAPERTLSVLMLVTGSVSRSTRDPKGRAARQTPALAFGFLCSVFKEHPRRQHAHQKMRWCVSASRRAARPDNIASLLPAIVPNPYILVLGRLLKIHTASPNVKSIS